MRKAAISLALLALGILSSCGSRPPKNAVEIPAVSSSPPPAVEYSKQVDVYRVTGNPDWSKIGSSLIATTVLSEKSRTAGIGIPLSVQSATDGRRIFFRVTWADPEPHRSADWDRTEKLAFNWEVKSDGFASQGCGAACHFWPPAYLRGRVIGMWLPEPDGLADNWVWMALPSGAKIEHRKLTGKPTVTFDAMAGMKRHKMRLAYFDDRSAPQTLREEADYAGGSWTVLISRALATKNRNEVQFDPAANPFRTFGLSVFPGVMYHDYSGMLTLHFLKR